MKNRKSSFIHTIVILVAIVFFYLGMRLVLLPAVLEPWSLSLTGGSTLVGEWYGEMTTPTGRKRVVKIGIGTGPGSCRGCTDIAGSARVCDNSGNINEFEVWGDTDNWSGSKFHLSLRPKDNRRYELELGRVEGEWHDDALRLTTKLLSGLNASTSVISRERDETGKERTTIIGAHPDTLSPVTWTLRKGSDQDFSAACGRLN
jgi:hypothetical protein